MATTDSSHKEISPLCKRCGHPRSVHGCISGMGALLVCNARSDTDGTGYCNCGVMDEDFEAKKIAYLFGPVSGEIERAKVRFSSAQRELEARGYEVWNPLERANNPAAEAEEQRLGKKAAGQPGWQDVMRKCFQDVCGADELWGLEGWEESGGAQIEVFVAQVIGTPVYRFPSGVVMNPRMELTRYIRPMGSILVWPR